MFKNLKYVSALLFSSNSTTVTFTFKRALEESKLKIIYVHFCFELKFRQLPTNKAV